MLGCSCVFRCVKSCDIILTFYFAFDLHSDNNVTQAPKKVSSWIDPLDAFDFASDCTQINFQTLEVFGSEDCLYLNVFAPVEAVEQANDGNFSVIVYIMGESFQSGSAQHYGPDFLIEKDVIVVSVMQLIFTACHSVCVHLYTCMYYNHICI